MTIERKPLYQYTTDELRALLSGGVDSRTRQTIQTILVNRKQQETNPAAFQRPVSHRP